MNAYCDEACQGGLHYTRSAVEVRLVIYLEDFLMEEPRCGGEAGLRVLHSIGRSIHLTWRGRG